MCQYMPVIPLPVHEYLLLDDLVALLGIVVCLLEPFVGVLVMGAVLHHMVPHVSVHLEELGGIEKAAVTVLDGKAVKFEADMMVPILIVHYTGLESLCVHPDIVMMTGMVRIVCMLAGEGLVRKDMP